MLAAALVVCPAAAAATPGAQPAPQTRCAVTDPDLAELSGMVVDDGGLVATVDSGRRVELHRLGDAVTGDDCAVTDTRTVDIDPADAEDLARGPDGALWVADIGDNAEKRDTVAVIVVPVEGRPSLHRLSYPDGPHDAEALLVDPLGRPVVITKRVGTAGVYRTAGPPDGTGPTPLERVGDLALPTSTTSGGPLRSLGSRTITGAAATVDGRVVAVRTYTDAWLFPAPDGDPVAALTGARAAGTPVQVPLPGEPQGEAIAFAADGTLLSGSETRRGVPGEIRSVPGAASSVPDPGGAPAAAEPAADAPPTVAGPGAADPAAAGSQESTSMLPAALGGAVVVGVLLAGIVAMSLPRRRR